MIPFVNLNFTPVPERVLQCYNLASGTFEMQAFRIPLESGVTFPRHFDVDVTYKKNLTILFSAYLPICEQTK